MSTTVEDRILDQDLPGEDTAPVTDVNGFRGTRAFPPAGASPAVPRDPRLLRSEADEYEANEAARQAAVAKAAADEAASRAAAAKAAAEKSRIELEAARAEAKAKAEAAALQVRMERQEEAEKAAAARAQTRARRAEQLGTVTPVAEAEPRVVTVTRRSTDQFAGALGLFLVRVVLAAWVVIVGWQSVTTHQPVLDAMTRVGVPQNLQGALVWLVGWGLITLGLFLFVGLATRIVAAVVLAGTAVFLAFYRFGAFSPFLEGHFGFYGDRDVFIAVISLLLVLMGAGGWSADARVRKGRANRQQENLD